MNGRVVRLSGVEEKSMKDTERAVAALAAMVEARKRAGEEARAWLDKVESAKAEVVYFGEELGRLQPSGPRLHAEIQEGDNGQHPRVVVTLGAPELMAHQASGEVVMTSPARLVLELQLSCRVRVCYHPLSADRSRDLECYELGSFLPTRFDASSLRGLLASFVERAAQDDWPDQTLKGGPARP
jgi:hypothetical protein